MALASAAVLAHGEPRSDLRVVLDGVKPAVAGLRVQVFDDQLAPQLVVENATGRTLEIFDDNRRGFVRIGPAGVQADAMAAAWYRTLSPGGSPLPAAAGAADAREQWRFVRPQVSWGWFDWRLQKDAIEVPGSIRQKAEFARVKSWSIPARLGHQALEIHGHFLYQPHPTGVFQARLGKNADLAPFARVTLSPGQPPALLLENLGDQDVIVLGAHGEPFIRIRPDGVDGNLSSSTWQDLGRYRGLGDLPANDSAGGYPEAGPKWHRVSLAPRYSWLEPRAAVATVGFDPQTQNHPRSTVKGWQVPILVGGRSFSINGVVEWVPLPAAGEPRKH
jgi:hypothetical protein